MAVRALFWKNTRSTATASGRYSASRARKSSARAASRRGRGSVAGVVNTPAPTTMGAAASPPRQPYPQRDTPGSMPSTNTRSNLVQNGGEVVDPGGRSPYASTSSKMESGILIARSVVGRRASRPGVRALASAGTETTENCLELSTTERPRSTCATLTTVARQITQRELRNDSGEIMRGLDGGESFVITRNGVPVGELTPLHRRRFVSAEILVAAFADA